jgi:hypothetical protein
MGRIIMGRVNLAVFTVSIVLLSVNPFAFQNEPDGFRGIKWGTDISTLKGMIHVRSAPRNSGVVFYRRKGDELRFGDAQLDKLEYAFWNGKFSSVWIHSVGYANWLDLHDATTAEFGEGYQPHRYIEQYLWYGSSTMILLQYNQIGREGMLSMFSQMIIKQQEEYNNETSRRRGKKRI